jgi:hypothetical protein
MADHLSHDHTARSDDQRWIPLTATPDSWEVTFDAETTLLMQAGETYRLCYEEGKGVRIEPVQRPLPQSDAITWRHVTMVSSLEPSAYHITTGGSGLENVYGQAIKLSLVIARRPENDADVQAIVEALRRMAARQEGRSDG